MNHERSARAAAAPQGKREHPSLPLFWPLAAAMAVGGAGIEWVRRNAAFLAEAELVGHAPKPAFATPSEVVGDLHTLQLRAFGRADPARLPVLVVAPYAGHSATIADFAPGQSLVRTLLTAGVPQVHVTDWKSATLEMKDYDIDNYLAELNVCVDDLGGRVQLVGLCQGGWLSAMYAARFAHRVAALVLAGAPIDTHAGDGPLRELVSLSPPGFYEELVALGGGLMRGRLMLRGWKNMNPDQQYLGKYVELYEHIDDPGYVARTENFERWYENPLDLPGRWYLQTINELFRDNRLAGGSFVALGRTLSLQAITCPLYLLAGAGDEITPAPQVFAAQALVGTPASAVVQATAPGGHIGLFMGSATLKSHWPGIAAWLLQHQAA